MKLWLLIACALCVGLAAPASAASKPHHAAPIYCTAIGGWTTFIADGKPYTLPSNLVRYLGRSCIYVPSFEAEAQTITGHAMAPWEYNAYQLVDHNGGIGNLRFDDVTGGLVISPGTGLNFPVAVTATFNSTAPIVASGATAPLQADANAALIVTEDGKTYVVLNQANVTCTNLFSSGIRVTGINNPGIAQTHPFVLYDENTNSCTGTPIFGNTHPNEATGPILGAAQYIHVGVRTTNGLTIEWFGGGVVTGSTPYIQVQ